MSTFGLTADTSHKLTSRQENEGKAVKLVERIRRDVKELGLVYAATDKEKLINVLIMNQQLNIIDPPVIEQLVSNENTAEPRTIKSILKSPPMPQRTKQKCKRNVKVAYGVVTADEIITEIDEREVMEARQEGEREEDEIVTHQREKQIQETEGQVREIRHKLNVLKAENTAKNKEFAIKKKGRKAEKM